MSRPTRSTKRKQAKAPLKKRATKDDLQQLASLFLHHLIEVMKQEKPTAAELSVVRETLAWAGFKMKEKTAKHELAKMLDAVEYDSGIAPYLGRK